MMVIIGWYFHLVAEFGNFERRAQISKVRLRIIISEM